MLAKKIIPCMDIRDGKVVKGIKFEDVKDVSDPVELAAFYNSEGADELVFYDITASTEGRKPFYELLKKVVEQISIPLIVGGGISVIEDFDRVFAYGADKVSVNSGVIKNPDIIAEAAKKYGGRRIILSMDIKLVDGVYRLFSRGGMDNTGIDALEWARRGEANGAGELVVNSIDMDGVKKGYDLELLDALQKCVSIPIVASGGAGNMEHFAELFSRIENAGSGLAASIFHYREVRIPALKRYLHEKGIPVKL